MEDIKDLGQDLRQEKQPKSQFNNTGEVRITKVMARMEGRTQIRHVMS